MFIENNRQRVFYFVLTLVALVAFMAITSTIDTAIRTIVEAQISGSTPNARFLTDAHWTVLNWALPYLAAALALSAGLTALLFDAVFHIYTFGVRKWEQFEDWREERQARKEEERQEAFEADMARLGYTNKTTMVFVFVPVPTRVFVGPMAANRDERDHDVHASV